MKVLFKRVNWIHAITISYVHRSTITIHLFGDMPLQFVLCLRCAILYVFDALRSTRKSPYFRMVRTAMLPLFYTLDVIFFLLPFFFLSSSLSPRAFLLPFTLSLHALHLRCVARPELDAARPARHDELSRPSALARGARPPHAAPPP